MRLLLTGDWHITDKKPSRRLDLDYFGTCMSKLEQIAGIFKEEGCHFVIQAGDFFDTPNVPLSLIINIDNFINDKLSGGFVYSIYGQHDTHFHSKEVENTPLNLLHHCGSVKIENNIHLTSSTFLKCVSWFDPIPEKEKRIAKKQILVLHKTISDGYAAFESTDAKTLLDRLDYDLILSGDNHKQFGITSNGKHLVNPGSLMRSSIDQTDHEPAVYIYDTEAVRIRDVIKRVPLKVKPVNEVFDLEKFEQEKELDGKVVLFADEITGNLGGNLDFVDSLKKYLDSLHLDHITKDILKRVTGGRV